MSVLVSIVLSASAGQFVAHTYNPGYIILSFLVSLSGAWTTVELLHRRTSPRGLYNWYLLLAAASSMGAVAIWSMHFIGNRAIQMGNGEPELQIGYNPGFTAASFFLPICVVAFSFYFFSVVENVNVVTTLLAGWFTGAAVCGMHYMGQGGIANYTPSYGVGYVVGSAIIAVVASTVAMGILFYLTSTWTNNWLKRLACAVLLATSVSGMHWVASVGTTYRLKEGTASPRNGLSRRATVVVVLCLALGCCVVLFVLAWLGQWSRRRAAERAERVSLACAIFDADGKVMVTPGGLLPCCKITDSDAHQSFEDVFNVEHPAFCWIYRASRCWNGIADIIPAIRASARDRSNLTQSRAGFRQYFQSEDISPMTLSRITYGIEDIEEYSQLFRKMFLAAAGDLADMIQQPIENLGLLFEDIIKTGTLTKGSQTFFAGIRNLFSKSSNFNPLECEERGSPVYVSSRGQLLFLIRRATRDECHHFQSSGFRFATLAQIIEPLARSMEVAHGQLLPRLERMQIEAGKSHMYSSGVHVAFFAVRPIYQQGFEVLARSDARSLVPTAALSIPRLSGGHIDVLSLFNNMTVGECLATVEHMIKENINPEEREFLSGLFLAIHQVFDPLPEQLWVEARLLSRPLRAPCRGTVQDPEPRSTDMITFRTIADLHQNIVLPPDFVFVPWRLFKTQQHCFEHAHDNHLFENRVRREYAALATSHALRHAPSFAARSQPVSRSSLSRLHAGPTMSRTASTGVASAQSHSGIEVHNEWSVIVSDRPRTGTHDLELRRLGNHAEAVVALPYMDRESWAEILIVDTISTRERPDTVTRPLPAY